MTNSFIIKNPGEFVEDNLRSSLLFVKNLLAICFSLIV